MPRASKLSRQQTTLNTMDAVFSPVCGMNAAKDLANINATSAIDEPQLETEVSCCGDKADSYLPFQQDIYPREPPPHPCKNTQKIKINIHGGQ